MAKSHSDEQHWESAQGFVAGPVKLDTTLRDHPDLMTDQLTTRLNESALNTSQSHEQLRDLIYMTKGWLLKQVGRFLKG